MAETQLKDECMVCGKKLWSGDIAHFIGGVTLVNTKTRSLGYAPTKQGKLRIKHITGKKPRGLICNECTYKLFSI